MAAAVAAAALVLLLLSLLWRICGPLKIYENLPQVKNICTSQVLGAYHLYGQTRVN